MISFVELLAYLPQYETNYCTNPSFETGTTGWGATTNCAISRSTVQAKQGTYALTMTMTTAGTDYFCYYNSGTLGLVPAAPGQVWTGGAWMRTPRATTVRMYACSFNASGAQISTVNSSVAIAANTWTWVQSPAYTLPALTTQVALAPYVVGTGGAANEVTYVDAVVLEQAATITTQGFSGDTPSDSTGDYFWTGAPSASSSQRRTKDVTILPKFGNLSFDSKYNDIGTIQFDYPLDDATTLGLGDQFQVGVRIGYDDGTYADVEKYTLESTGNDRVADGIRLRTFDNSRSILALLDDAIIYPSNWPATIPAIGYNGLVSSPIGHQFVNATIGTIFRTLITRAQTRGALTQVKPSFSGTQDSNGNPWSSLQTEIFADGTSYLQILTDYMQRGLVDAYMRPDGTFDLYNGTTSGRHVTIDTIEVRPAKNATELKTSTTSADACSAVLIEGDTGSIIERTSTTALSAIGRRRERYVAQGGIKDSGVLAILGDAELGQFGRIQTEESVGLVDQSSTRPFVDYKVGDWIQVRYDTTQPPVERRIYQMGVALDANRNITLGVTLNSIIYEDDIRLKRRVDAYTGNGGTYGSVQNSHIDLTVPNPPTGVGVTSGYYTLNGLYAGAYVVNWVAPTTNADSTAIDDLASYNVQWKYNGDTTWSGSMPTTLTTLQYSPVTPGRSVDVRVQAVDSSGNVSVWTTVLNTPLSADTTAPPVPSTPDAQDGIGEIQIYWDGKDSTGTTLGTSTVSDFAYVEVWESTSSTFTPPTSGKNVGTMRTSGFVSSSGGAYGQTMYYKLCSVDGAANRSAPSGSDSATKRYYVTDGTPPASSPTPVVTGGVQSLLIQWTPITNQSLVTYDVHLSPTSGFTPSPSTLVVSTTGAFFVARTLTDGTQLTPAGVYYAAVVARDDDGSAAASAQTPGSPTQVNTPDIAVNAITADQIVANSVTGDKFNAVLIMALKMVIGDRITISDSGGIQIRTDAGDISFPSDGTAASIAADLTAFSLTVMDSLNVRGANNYIAGSLSAAAGVLDPNTPATLSNYWASDNVAGLNFARSVQIARGQNANELYGLVATFSGPSLAWQIYSYTPGSGTETLVATLSNAGFGTNYSPSISVNPFFLANDGLYYVMCYAPTGTSGVYTYKLVKYNAAFVKQGEFAISMPGLGANEFPVVGADTNVGTSPNYGIVVAWRRASDSKVCFQSYLASGATTGALKVSPSTISTTSRLDTISGAAYGPLAYQVAVNNVLYSYTAAGVRSSSGDYASPPRTPHSTWPVYGVSNTILESFVELDGNNLVWHYTGTSTSENVGASYTWYDADPAGTHGAGTESRPSPAIRFNRSAGAMTRIDIPAAPNGGDPDDPDTARLYMAAGGSSTYQLQGTFTVGQTAAAISYIASGAAPPTTSGWAGRAGSTGLVKASASDTYGPLWVLYGDGSGRVGHHAWSTLGQAFNSIRLTTPQRLVANDMTVATGTTTTIRYTGVVADTDPTYGWTVDTALNGTGRATCNRAGRYLLEGVHTYGSNGTNQRTFYVNLNNSTVVAYSNVNGAAASGSPCSFQSVIDLAAGDYLNFILVQNSGSSLGIYSSAYGYAHFTATRIG